jgi:N,N'-diacetyllegionaminate synthase
MVSATPGAARCRVIAVVEHGAVDVAASGRLMKEVEAAGADGVKVAVRAARGGSARGESCVDDIKRILDATELDVVVAPYDLASVEQLAPLGFQAWQIDAPLLTHLPLLGAVAADGRTVLASVAGCTARELQEGIDRLPAGAVILHTLIFAGEDLDVADVAYMSALRRYGHPVGYADCAVDPTPSLVAAALGATIIEKPLTLDRLVTDADRRASLLPHEFRAFVNRLRRLETVLAGDGTRDPLPDELDIIEQDRVSVVAARAIPRGTAISADMLMLKSPGAGLPPRLQPLVEGRRALYDLPEGALVTFGMIEP